MLRPVVARGGRAWRALRVMGLRFRVEGRVFRRPPPARGAFSVLRVSRVDPRAAQRPQALVAGMASAGGASLTVLIRPLAHGVFASATARSVDELPKAEGALEAALRVGLGPIELERAPADLFHLSVPLAGALPRECGSRGLVVPCGERVRVLAILEVSPVEGSDPDLGSLVSALAEAGVEGALTLSVSPGGSPAGSLALALLTGEASSLGDALREADSLCSLACAAVESSLGWRARRVGWPRVALFACALLERRVPRPVLRAGDLVEVAGVPFLPGMGGLTEWAPRPRLEPPPKVEVGLELGLAVGLGWSTPLRLAVEQLPLHVAVFGAPGCGKTTLVRRLLSQYVSEFGGSALVLDRHGE
ncbi:MAG TPA: DUF87 domain-containing protein, partial [Candidatus Korarchaeota archaeon]|nr:DUF87 domain-containing protein [Candidatus Korarchaeota archaeon]